MRVIQVVPRLAYGDAVGNDVLALMKAIRKNGYKTDIFAAERGPGITTRQCRDLQSIPRLERDDILLYHFAIGTELNYRIVDFPCRKVIVYHNITPACFFHGVSSISERLCEQGRDQLRFLASRVDACIADSEYNKRDLRVSGFKCPICVVPILLPFADYDAAPSPRVLLRYEGDGYTNVVFTGRVAPNKKHEDLIACFHYYQKYYNAKSRLFLVGSYNGMETYYYKLGEFAKAIGVRGVHFSGKVSFDELLAYYRIANAFLCMSEHEGFCVPLVEAMKFNIPIIAYNSSAVGETLGNAGILLNEKNALEVAGVVNRVLSDTKLRKELVENGGRRLQDFSYESVERRFSEALSGFIREWGQSSDREAIPL